MTVREHLNSFKIHMDALVHYCSAVDDSVPLINLNDYDIIIIHYSIRVALGWHISPHFDSALEQYEGILVMFVQDEYDNVHRTHSFIRKHQPQLFFTCVPKKYHNVIYPEKEFPTTKFVSNLTGYIPSKDNVHVKQWKPLEERINIIGYRGRRLPAKYGNLGREKYVIARNVKEYCIKNNIGIDIEWEDEKRIYKDDWHDFISNCRSCLGTESGSNVFDFTGEIETKIEAFKIENPDANYDEIYLKFVEPYDDFIKMNQVSPRLFECIAHGTILVLNEGEYSGILKPGEHYLSLKKDFSNIGEVIDKLDNNMLCETIRNNAYNDIIVSNDYSYKNFIHLVCHEVSNFLPTASSLPTKFKWNEDLYHKLLPRPSTYRIHGFSTDFPIDVSDYSLVNLPTTYIESKNKYPGFLVYLAPLFPKFLKTFIKRNFFGYNV